MAWNEVGGKKSTTGSSATYVRYNALADGDVAVEGTYKGKEESNFSTEEAPKYNYVFEKSDGQRIVLNPTGHLNWLMEFVEPESVARVVYLGKHKPEGKSKFPDTPVHRFQVLVDGEGDGEPF